MDVLCRLCSEPWDHDTLHDVAEETGRTYSAVAADFRKRGCKALGDACNEDAKRETLLSGHRDGISAVYDVCGDDMDAAAAFFADIMPFA